MGLVFILSQPGNRPKKIGIIMDQKFFSSSGFLQGIRFSLRQQGYYEGLNCRFVTARPGNTDQWRSALQKMSASDLDLLVLLGSRLPLATIRTAFRKPVLFGFSDQSIAEQLKTIIEKEKTITGVSYITPYQQTLELAQRILGRYKKLVIVLPPNPTWRMQDAAQLQAAADRSGVTVTVLKTAPSELFRQVAKLERDSSVVYLPNEPAWLGQRNQLRNTFRRAQLPVITNVAGFRDLAVFAYYPEPETMGELAGRMMVKIFHGSITEYMPIEFSNDFQLAINLTNLEKLNLPIDEDVLSYANEVIQ